MDSEKLRWGLDRIGYLRPDQFLDHLTVIIRLNDNHISEQHTLWLLILRLSWNTRNIWSSTYNVDLLTSTSINQNVASQWLTSSHCFYIDNPNLGMCITILQCQQQTLFKYWQHHAKKSKRSKLFRRWLRHVCWTGFLSTSKLPTVPNVANVPSPMLRWVCLSDTYVYIL